MALIVRGHVADARHVGMGGRARRAEERRRAPAWKTTAVVRSRPSPSSCSSVYLFTGISSCSPSNCAQAMASGQPKPAWLTDELADVEEWVDWQDDDNSVDSIRSGSDLSLTQPLGSVLVRNNDLRSTSDASRSDESADAWTRQQTSRQRLLQPSCPGEDVRTSFPATAIDIATTTSRQSHRCSSSSVSALPSPPTSFRRIANP
ncbi:hypothetical protein NUW54_g2782 [Trametes sanguinea]|uniref:Uncharacterized protein n=1 Tax=Trametes sanguinea TaxID=158606 RepID=A0ACC1Q5R4_9APHY|nr:hypothetical protein NUW54_g2782 [Trametes sanguinea]